MMKTTALLTLFVTIVFAHWTEHHNGKPGCQTDLEITQKMWRNNHDPTKYFVCDALNSPATTISCQQEYLFDPTQLRCVPHREWIWVQPFDPPSMATM